MARWLPLSRGVKNMDTLDKKHFAALCRDFIDAAAPAIHNGLEYDSEPETPQKVMTNLRFVFTAAMPYFFRDTMLEMAGMLAPERMQDSIARNQDKAAMAFADTIAARLMADHSLFAIRRFVPKTLNTAEGRDTARQLQLKNLQKIL